MALPPDSLCDLGNLPDFSHLRVGQGDGPALQGDTVLCTAPGPPLIPLPFSVLLEENKILYMYVFIYIFFFREFVTIISSSQPHGLATPLEEEDMGLSPFTPPDMSHDAAVDLPKATPTPQHKALV